MKYDQIDTLQRTNISPTSGKGTSSSNMPWENYMLLPRRVLHQVEQKSFLGEVHVSTTTFDDEVEVYVDTLKFCTQISDRYEQWLLVVNECHISPRNKKCLTFCFRDSILSKNHFPQENPPKRNEPFGIGGTSICKGQCKMSRLPGTYNLTCNQCSTDYSGAGKRWYGLYNPLEGNTYLVY